MDGSELKRMDADIACVIADASEQNGTEEICGGRRFIFYSLMVFVL